MRERLAWEMIEETKPYGKMAAIVPEDKILIVDDYEPNLLVAGTYVKSFGYPYDIAVNGNDAIEKIKKNQYAAILMDVQMPGMDGLETTTAIRNFEMETGRSRQPIIALTAHPFVAGGWNCASAGMDAFMTKPFNPAEFEKLLKSLMAHSEKEIIL